MLITQRVFLTSNANLTADAWLYLSLKSRLDPTDASLSSSVATSAVVLVLRSAVLFDSSLGLFSPEKPRPINLVGLSQMFGQDVKDAGKVNRPPDRRPLFYHQQNTAKHYSKIKFCNHMRWGWNYILNYIIWGHSAHVKISSVLKFDFQ